MLNYLVEFLGTFFFLSVILMKGEAIPIGMALAVAIYFGGSISGGHFNPAVSIMKLTSGDIDLMTCVVYIVVQILGGLAAYGYYESSKLKL